MLIREGTIGIVVYWENLVMVGSDWLDQQEIQGRIVTQIKWWRINRDT